MMNNWKIWNEISEFRSTTDLLCYMPALNHHHLLPDRACGPGREVN
jgi:hypothetical protein